MKLDKFTDEEVIKALECCLNEDCENCPARMCCDDDTESFVKYVFDLINRLKAQNDRDVKVKVEALYKVNDLKLENERQKAEIERLTKANERFAKEFDSYYAYVKSEAIKEFAERLKERTYPFPCAIGVENAVTIRAINDLVKEMTEKEDNG